MAGHTRLILGRRLVVFGEYVLALVTLRCRRFAQVRVNSHSFVEDKTLAVEVVASAPLEVVDDPAFQLIYV